MNTPTEGAPPSEEGLPLRLAVDLQDHLMAATNDLERLQGLLACSCDTLIDRFQGIVARVGDLQGDPPPERREAVLRDIGQQLSAAVTALQFQDVASQLITHTHQRLRNCADQIALEAFGPDADGEAVVEPAPLRPNPVTQDEMDAGSIELF